MACPILLVLPRRAAFAPQRPTKLRSRCVNPMIYPKVQSGQVDQIGLLRQRRLRQHRLRQRRVHQSSKQRRREHKSSKQRRHRRMSCRQARRLQGTTQSYLKVTSEEPTNSPKSHITWVASCTVLIGDLCQPGRPFGLPIDNTISAASLMNARTPCTVPVEIIKLKFLPRKCSM